MTEPLTEPIKHYLTCHAQDPFHPEGDGCWDECAEAIEALDARANPYGLPGHVDCTDPACPIHHGETDDR